jgi:tetratricopeptide (TPR) repeat protein
MMGRKLWASISIIVGLAFLLPVAIGLMQGRVIEIELVKPRTAKEALQQAYTKHFQEKDYQGAIEKYRWVVEKFPDSEEAVEAQYRIGNIYQWNLFELGKAIQEYQKVVDKGQNANYVAESLMRIGECYGALGKAEKALSYYLKVIEDYPDTLSAGWALYHIGEHHQESGRFQEAVSIYNDVIERFKDRRLTRCVRCKLGEIYLCEGKLDKATSEFKNLLSNPEIPDDVERYARYNLGICYLIKKDYVAALREFKKILDYTTEDIEALYHVGYQITKLAGCNCPVPDLDKIKVECSKLVQVHKERFPEIVKKVISEAPKNSHAHYLLGKFYLDMGEYDKSLSELSKIPFMSGDYAEACHLIALCYFRKRDYSKAVEDLRAKIGNLADSEYKAVILLDIARGYHMLEDFTSARRYYNMIIESYPGRPEAEVARIRLDIMNRMGL